MTGRSSWHRRAGWLPLAYLGAIAVIAVMGALHPVLPWRWLAIHTLLLGAVTNAILIWSVHFALAVLHAPAPARRFGEALRLATLNTGVVTVLVAEALGLGWLGLVGAGAVFAAVAMHLYWLYRRLRTTLPGPYRVTVHYYAAASVALLTGIPVGAFLLVASPAVRPRLVLFHAHVNLFGWVTLTVLGTLLTLGPTVLRTRMAGGAVRDTRRALPIAGAGLGILSAGILGWWPGVSVAGLVLFLLAVLAALRPTAQAALCRPPASFAAWSMAAAAGWLLVSLALDSTLLASASTAAAALARSGGMLAALLAGFAAQTLIGALAYLLPVGLGGGPARVAAATAALDRHGRQRVVVANAALAVFLLPVGPYVRITTSLLGLAVLVQFLVAAGRVMLAGRRHSVSSEEPGPVTPNPAAPGGAWPTTAGAERTRVLGSVAGGAALVVLAIVAGVAAQSRAPAPAATGVAATGATTTVAVTASGMRYHPDRISVPAGDRLVIELTNRDHVHHDLVLANGASTGIVAGGATVRLDAGIIGETVDGWCSLPGHRQAGMTLTITATSERATGPASEPHVDTMADPGPDFTARDATAPGPPANRVHRIELRVEEVVREVAPGVSQALWAFNGTVPGPLLRGRVGDTFDITLINDGSIDHGVDFHASALAPDGPMRPIEPGQRLAYRFTATRAGMWMYHCSTMPMLGHIGNGMYGAIIIDPPDLVPAGREFFLVQSELYLGPAGDIADVSKLQAEQPDAVVFNGYPSQYAFRPLVAAAGERVRFWVLNAGPSRASAFHIVGAQFDTVYREGRYELRPDHPGGAQVLDLLPGAGGFVETVFGEPGHYPFVSHVMVDAERGARGIVAVQ